MTDSFVLVVVARSDVAELAFLVSKNDSCILLRGSTYGVAHFGLAMRLVRLLLKDILT